jgi:hypothetical protein
MLRQLSMALLVNVAALMILAASALAEPAVVGHTAAAEVESPHPYPSGAAQEPTLVWQTTVVHPNATMMKLHFARLELADAHDYVVIRNPLTGETETLRSEDGPADVWSNLVAGDQLIVELYANNSQQGYGLYIDMYAHGTLDVFQIYGSMEERACDYQWIQCSPRDALGDPVGAVFVAGQDPGSDWSFCTGFLVNHEGQCRLATCDHCVPDAEPCNNVDVFFNYEVDCNTGVLKEFDGPYRCINIAAGSDNTLLDFSKLDLAGGWLACNNWGTIPLREAADPLAVGDELFMIGHPNGFSKHISEQPMDANCSATVLYDGPPCGSGVAAASYLKHGCDASPGSSGSPIMKDYGTEAKAVAMLKAGVDCVETDADDNNCGVHIELIKPGGPTPARPLTWGSLKGMYR